MINLLCIGLPIITQIGWAPRVVNGQRLNGFGTTFFSPTNALRRFSSAVRELPSIEESFVALDLDSTSEKAAGPAKNAPTAHTHPRFRSQRCERWKRWTAGEVQILRRCIEGSPGKPMTRKEMTGEIDLCLKKPGQGHERSIEAVGKRHGILKLAMNTP